MSNKKKGILCIVASAFCFALMNVFVKLAGDLPSVEKSFFRNCISLLVAAFVLLKNRESLHVPPGARLPLFARALFGTLGLLCNFYAVDHLLLADATAIQKLVPFVTILTSWALLKEKVKSWQMGLVLLAFASSLLVIKPGLNPDLGPALIQVIGALCAGTAYTLVRLLTLKGVNKSLIIFYFSAFSCVAVIPFVAAGFVMPSLFQWFCLLMTGVCASGGQYAITYAYGFAPARQISIYDYSQILFSALFGLVIFGQRADALSWLGYVLLAGCALANFRLQNKK